MKEKSKYDVTLEAVIEAHRQLIHDRYDYDEVIKSYHFPKSFTKERALELRSFFMDYVYPDIKQREELNDAFQHLDEFIKRPDKIIGILKDSISIMFKYGRHLPGIMSAGIKALKSFRSASKLEDLLAVKALQKQVEGDITQQELKELLKSIPNEVLDKHQESIWPLYEVLLDQKLVDKILEVITTLISKMRKKPKIYSPEEIKGVEAGQEMIVKAKELFGVFDQDDLELCIEQITLIEKAAYQKFMPGESND